MSTPNPTGSYTSEEQRKFNEFLLELLDVGCTKGFRNFSTHLRGREEMTVKIVNEPSVPVVLTSQVASPGFSLNQSILRENLPRSRQSMLLSGRWQRRLSGYGNGRFIDYFDSHFFSATEMCREIPESFRAPYVKKFQQEFIEFPLFL